HLDIPALTNLVHHFQIRLCLGRRLRRRLSCRLRRRLCHRLKRHPPISAAHPPFPRPLRQAQLEMPRRASQENRHQQHHQIQPHPPHRILWRRSPNGQHQLKKQRSCPDQRRAHHVQPPAAWIDDVIKPIRHQRPPALVDVASEARTCLTYCNVDDTGTSTSSKTTFTSPAARCDAGGAF